ncbi:2670_t:CDS:2 [Funneliformis mosseae]|uniref:2670_t:CDS:1 n=1 Tax=Funneliformis mosseae TaxID=27381 RepID=A0A9N9DYX2_FUNMO|nr:2670_t:CDS:2 [Funneliformis mosseae]
MPILPTTSPRSSFHSDSQHKRRRSTYWSASIPLFLRRLFRFPQMDFEFALWQMLYLCIAPRRVYRNIYYHKRKNVKIIQESDLIYFIKIFDFKLLETKNQWARDDPAFVVILSFFLGVSAIAWGLVYGHGLIGILKMSLFMVFVDFVVVGMIISTICWVFANRFLTHRHTIHAVEQTVEWAYAFDVHCNSFFPLFLILYVAQFFLMRVLIKDIWICLFLGNTMYLIAIGYYCYITFLGYNALPFLLHTEMFLYPVALFLIVYVISLFGFHISANVLQLYFGR